MKLGSLFDGSGGFPLAGALNGIEPVWASEIEPYPMRVTALRFPNMKQLGDITKIDGRQIEPVDIITFGSPCQDLSVAGKQAGIHDGARSSLFFEAIRIIKEMREATNGKYPRYCVWENVPGAFSSNKGADFRAVLEAFCEIKGGAVSLPQPKKWEHTGVIVGEGYSIAWRLYDAQFWGVPQRRKRIYALIDLTDGRAGEILPEPDRLSGNPAESREAWERAAQYVAGCPAGGCGELKIDMMNQGAGNESIAHENATTTNALKATHFKSPPVVCCAAGFVGRQGAKAGSIGYETEKSPTLRAGITTDVVYCIQGNCIDRADTAGCNGKGWRTDKCYTLNTIDRPAIAFTQGSFMECITNGKTATLMARDYKQAQAVAIPQEGRKYIVRRLTPLEYCRLQGFPDWWTDGIDGSDSALYKMWGNGIALPCAFDVLRRIVEHEDI